MTKQRTHRKPQPIIIVFFYNLSGEVVHLVAKTQDEVLQKIAWCIENKRAATVKVNGYIVGRVVLEAAGWVYNDYTKMLAK